MSARLEYFQELEHATRMLNHPGDSLVLQADFLEMVERVDICIDFLRTHVRIFHIIVSRTINEFVIPFSVITVKQRSIY